MLRCLAPLVFLLGSLAAPPSARAWGYAGHEVIAAIARAYLTPKAKAAVDAILGADPDSLTATDMVSRATWADAYRGAGHRETASWHFVDLELDRPDLSAACFGFPASQGDASTGSANDCIVDKLGEFTRELADPTTNPSERQLALKFVLHFVGDIHQPLHASDNQDRGGNCVQLALGGPRTTNLHSYWDTAVVQALGSDPSALAQSLIGKITPTTKAEWERGDAKAWAMESYGVAKAKVYTLGSRAGCGGDQGPVSLPPGYAETAPKVAALQMERAGVRLAMVLNHALGS